jgi:5-methylcytosine-specific restriction protein A
MIRTTDQLRALYETSKWRRAARAFLRLNPLCADGCQQRAQVVDHIVPRSSARTEEELQRLTWDRSNWQGLTKAHHDAKTRRENGPRRLAPVSVEPSSAIVTRDYTRQSSAA